MESLCLCFYGLIKDLIIIIYSFIKEKKWKFLKLMFVYKNKDFICIKYFLIKF